MKKRTNSPLMVGTPTYDLWFEAGGLVGLILSMLVFVGVFAEQPEGVVLRPIIRALRGVFGVGSYVLPVFGASLCVALIVKKSDVKLVRTFGAFVLFFVAFLGFVNLSGFEPQVIKGGHGYRGGYLGYAVAAVLRGGFGVPGATIVLAGGVVAGFLAIGRDNLGKVVSFVRRAAVNWWAALQNDMRARSKERLADRLKALREEKAEEKSRWDAASKSLPDPEIESVEEDLVPDDDEEGQLLLTEREEATDKPPLLAKGQRRKRSSLLPDHFNAALDTLDAPAVTDVVDSEADSDRGVRLVEETLASFKIEAKVVNVKRGPVITRYEVQTAPGVRVNRIVNLADDLALALAAIDVRVEAPVPGKSVIGIEVPNKRVAVVRVKEILDFEDFREAPSKLTFALGKDIAGTPKVCDLARMPHLLISGATNSGKSVCLNSLIVSILTRARPDEVRLSLIDPKRVELTLFNGIPHLLHPVVVDAKGASKALRGAISEMDRRYRIFSDAGVRNIEGYNASVEEDEERLYHIVIIIDELADLMMQAAAEFERLICRIAQLARATGIHLVVATQRPSVNVITGVIKANIPSRIAFAVASQVDSRTIIDVNGAERLIGRGDMLYHPIDAPKAVRLQGAFVNEMEVNRVIDLLAREYGEPKEYPFEVMMTEEEERPESILADNDALFEAAVDLVRRRGYGSASMLQRAFEIGYPRAGKIVDQMEQAGIVGPAEGSKPRKVLQSDLGNDPLVESAVVDEDGADAPEVESS